METPDLRKKFDLAFVKSKDLKKNDLALLLRKLELASKLTGHKTLFLEFPKMNNPVVNYKPSVLFWVVVNYLNDSKLDMVDALAILINLLEKLYNWDLTKEGDLLNAHIVAYIYDREKDTPQRIFN